MKPYYPTTLISENKKTGCSINLPIKGHCRPTKRCKADCYAKSGHTALATNLRKQAFISDFLKSDDITPLIYECKRFTMVRLNGTGDLLRDHIPNMLSLAEACPQTEFWGMTRKINIAKALNNKLPNLSLLVTVDATSPQSIWNYQGALCFGPRRPEDAVPDDERIVTVFPRHHAGRIIGNVPLNKKDCPAVRHTVNGCAECGRCWKWKD